MNKKILFISIDGMTDMLGQSQVLPYLTGLSSLGYKISIASCEKEQNFAKNKNAVLEIVSKYNIDWAYCFYESKIPLISQLKNFLNLKKTASKQIVKVNKDVILHCRSYLPSLIGLQLKKKFKTKYVFDMRGFWADERIDGNIWSLKNSLHKFLYNYFKRKEIELIENADYIVTLTNNAKKEIETWKLRNLPPIEIIPCCTDVNHFTISSGMEKSSVRNKLNINDNSFVIGYLGSLGTWYMLDEMLDFFVELQIKKPNCVFFFVTNDKEEDVLLAAEKKSIKPASIVVKSAKRNEVPAYISCFDIGLFFIKPLYSKKGSSPTKMAEILACGVPIITNAGVGDVDEIILE
ncbi:MAG: glycosyltransferase, partial [Bacteroidia bacterium]